MDPLLQEAINQHARQTAESRLRQGSGAEQIKNLNSQIVEFSKGVPVIGEAVGSIAEPLISGFNFFTDNVLSPIFGMGPSQADIDKEEARQRRIAMRQIKLVERTEAQKIQRAQGMADFQAKAEQAGFGSTAEYSAFLKRSRKDRVRRR